MSAEPRGPFATRPAAIAAALDHAAKSTELQNEASWRRTTQTLWSGMRPRSLGFDHSVLLEEIGRMRDEAESCEQRAADHEETYDYLVELHNLTEAELSSDAGG